MALATERTMTRAIRYGFYTLCYAVLIALVLLPFLTGMESQEFWRW